MCSRTVSDPANRLLKRTDSEGSSSVAEKKSSAVPLFRSGHMLAICAGLSSKGKAGVQRGRKTAGCPSFLPTAVGTASSPRRVPRRSRRPQTANPPAEVQRKTSRPERANPPAAVRVPRWVGAEKEPPVRGEHACAVRVPRSAGAEKEPPVSAEPACGSSCAPVNRCRKAPGSTRDKNFQENMRYPLAKYAKIGYYIQALFCMNSRMMLNDVKNTIIWRHSDYDRR